MRVLVTGSDGFVGRWMMEHLAAEGDEGVGLDTAVDITEPEGLSAAVTAAAPDAICHLAAQASVGASWASSAKTFEVNALGTLHLMDAALACERPPRVLVVSSAEVYGVVGPDELPLTEDHPFAPASPYAASKAAGEMVAVQAWLGKGLEVVRARPFNHTGPGQRPDFVVPGLARQVSEARRHRLPTLEAGNLDVRRDITDVRDVVRAYRLLLQSGAPGEAYNVCLGESVSIASIARRLLEIAAIDLPIHVDPSRARAVDLPDLRGDPGRLFTATGWEPRIDLDRTLRDVLEYWTDK